MNMQDWGDRSEGIQGMEGQVLCVYFQKVSVRQQREQHGYGRRDYTHNKQ